MDFQQFVTEYFSDKVDRNPSSLANDNMQELLDLSRRQDLDSRQGQLNESEDSEEITEVDAQSLETASPAQRQEPATDSSLETTTLDEVSADPSAELPMELTEFKTSEQIDREVEYHDHLEVRQSALADEDMIPAELTRIPEKEERLEAQPNAMSEILGAEDVDFNLTEALESISQEQLLQGDEFGFTDPEFKQPPLPKYSQTFYDTEERIDHLGYQMLQRERWS
jgi:hypothetical protein